MPRQILNESTILVVDDEPDYLNALKSYLQKAGCTVQTAGDGETALALVAAQPPDLILLDVDLPGLDGFEICRRLKAAAASRPIPVLFLTAAKSPQDKLEGFEAGAVDYIGKPFQLAEAAARVETHLTLHRMRRELEAKNRALQREIEERRRTEEQIQFQASLLDQVHNAVIATDLQGRVSYWNRFAEKLYGWTETEAIGRHILELNVPPPRRRLAQEVLAGMKKKGHWEGEFTVNRKEGTTFLAHVVNSVIEDEAGQAVGFVGVSYDITRSKQMEAQVRYQAELVDNVSDAIISTDLDDFKIKSWNRAAEKIYGWTADEVIGRPIAQVTGLEYPDRATEKIVAEFLEKGAWEGKFTQKRKDGVVLQIYGRVRLIRDQAGRPVRAVAVNRDITRRKEMEAALQRSEERLRTIVQNMPVMVNAADEDKNFVMWNRECERVTGYKAEEIIGNPGAWEMLYPDPGYLESRLAMLSSPDREGDFLNWEWDICCKNGRVKTIAWSNVSKKYPVPGWAVWGIGVDVTERRQAEQALRESEERYRAVVESQTDLISRLRADGTLIFVNDVCCRFFNKSRQTLLGRRWQPMAAPEDGPHVEQQLAALTPDNPVVVIENRVYAGSGAIHWMEFVNRGFFDEQGRLAEIQAVGRDITGRKQVEERLRRSQRRYKRLSENMLGIVYQYHQFAGTALGEFLYVGPSLREIYELEPDQVLTNADWMWRSIHPDDRADFTASIIVASERLTPWQHEYRAVLTSGSLKWMQGYARPERQPDGSIVWDGILIEVTERKAAEMALRQAKEAAETANRAKSSFLAMMSHELRTPLNGVLGYAQILQRDPNLTPEQRRRVEVIEHSGQHLLHLINEVLDLAKIEAGKVELALTNFGLQPFLEDVTAGPRLRAESKGLQFRLETGPVPHTVRGDPKRLWQILLNLLNNAVKFTAEGWVTLRVSRRKSGLSDRLGRQRKGYRSPLSSPAYALLRFQVEDSGVGIPPDKLETIFEPFEQAGDPAEQIQGTGLGLAVCRRLVELMGGRLFIMSSVAGGAWISSAPSPLPDPAHLQGTLLWFDLPLPEAPAAAPAPPEPRSIIGFAGQPRRVLVIEDDAANRAVFGEMLTPLGFEVFTAADGQSGLSQAFNLQPDVLIVDVFLPGMDGFAVIRRLRRSETLQDRLIIAVSASVLPQQRQRCLEAGSDAFLSKPVQAETLYRLLKQHLDLTWLYAEPPSPSPPAVTEPPARDLVLPSPEVLHNLRQAVLIGDVTAILEQISRLKQAGDKRYQPFARRVQELAESFHLTELAAWLERLL